jgi:cytochrome b561
MWAVAVARVSSRRSRFASGIVEDGRSRVPTKETSDAEVNEMRAHFFLGLFTGVLFVGRLVAWARMKPVAPLSLGEGHRRFMKAIHIGLYAVGLAMVGAGMATSITSGWPAYLSGEIAAVPNFTGLREVHEILVFTFFGLVLLHVVGVLNHERVHGGTLRRMLSMSTR